MKKVLKGAGKAFYAAGKISKAMMRASKADGRALEAAGGHFGGQRMKLASGNLDRK